MTAAVSPLRDLTPYEKEEAIPPGTQHFNLAQSPRGPWPELTPSTIERALAHELSADGFAAAAVSLEDPEHEDAFAALGAGAEIYVSGALEQAAVDHPQSGQATLHLKLSLSFAARPSNGKAFDRQILDQDYEQDESLGPGQNTATVVNAALNSLFARAAKDAAGILKNPKLQAELGWRGQSGAFNPPAPLGGASVAP
ncbi:MAG: hypothetical protein KGL04_03245 [Elusimicrobia bacterium]|nr:hypothetical protein [Elusimicrobiota bacterium]